jgi:hypothetical protein
VIEVFNRFEQEAGRFDPTLLVVAGLVLAGLGLVIWLAGMCLRRLVLALAGAAAGGLTGWLVPVPGPVFVGLAAGGGAVLGAVLPRLTTAVLLAILGVAVAFVITARTHLLGGQELPSGPPHAGRGEERLTIPQSLGAVRVFAFDVVGRSRAAAGEMGTAGLAAIGAAGLVLLVLGFVLPRLAGTLFCSVLGTMLIFAGLIVLLIFKGSAPITLIEKQGALYGVVLFGMAAFGAVEQLALCPAPRRGKKSRSAGRSGPAESEKGWRNR